MTRNNAELLAMTDAVEDELRRLGARGNTLQAVVRDIAARRLMGARVRGSALAAARVYDRLVEGITPVAVETELLLMGIIALSEWIDVQSLATDASPSQHPFPTERARLCLARRPQPWVVFAALVPLVALAAGLFHTRLHVAAPHEVVPVAAQPARQVISRIRAMDHHDRWGRGRPVRDSAERARPDIDNDQ